LLGTYVRSLTSQPLLTKAVTGSIVGFSQEIISAHIARSHLEGFENATRRQSRAIEDKIDRRAIKAAAYEFLIGAPVSHVLFSAMAKTFGRTTGSPNAFARMLMWTLVVAPIQTFTYLAGMAIIDSADSEVPTFEALMTRVRAKYLKLLRVAWMIVPTAVLVAHGSIRPSYWATFFHLVSFMVATTFNVLSKTEKVR
ncbi:hypothetical protein DL93DRAFT_2047003, partial [Clavulina sp. PMI_390]